jgi:hypothetical protein
VSNNMERVESYWMMGIREGNYLYSQIDVGRSQRVVLRVCMGLYAWDNFAPVFLCYGRLCVIWVRTSENAMLLTSLC